ncbi:MAG: class I SAM-dependent methyltransferase [Acidobacteriota bacterium]
MPSSNLAGLRERFKRAIPAPWRRRLRRWMTEAPLRLRDALPDAIDAFRARRMPPAAQRRSVSLTSSRHEFDHAGRLAAADVLRAFETCRDPDRSYPRWLDFGCGAGRVARHVVDSPHVSELHGVDVDRGAVSWLAARSGSVGAFSAIPVHPPTSLAAAFYDVIYAVSVFTHFDARLEAEWLEEIARLLRPRGLLVATTLSPKLVWTRPDLTEAQRRELADTGFLFAPGSGPFNEDGAFSSRGRLEAVWGRRLRPRLFEEHGLAAYQDLSVWEKADED